MDKSSRIKIDFDRDFTQGIFPNQKYFEVIKSGKYQIRYRNIKGKPRKLDLNLEPKMRVIIDSEDDTLNIFQFRERLICIEKGITDRRKIGTPK